MTSHAPSLLKHVKPPIQAPVRTGLIFGGPDMGKTHLLASASVVPGVKALVITLDRSDETLAKFPNIEVLDLVRHSQGSYHKVMEDLIREFRTGKVPWNFVGFDSISKLVHLSRMEVVAEEFRRDMQNKSLSIGQRHDADIPEQRDYLRVTHRVTNYFWTLRNLFISKGVHFFVTAWERADWLVNNENLSGIDFYYPDMTPELRRLIMHEFGFCVRLTKTRATKRVMVKGKIRNETDFSRVLYAFARDAETKNRVGLPSKVVNPSAGTLLGLRSQPKKEALGEIETKKSEEVGISGNSNQP